MIAASWQSCHTDQFSYLLLLLWLWNYQTSPHSDSTCFNRLELLTLLYEAPSVLYTLPWLPMSLDSLQSATIHFLSIFYSRHLRFLARDAFIERIVALLPRCSFVRFSACLSGTGVHCDHMMHFTEELSLRLDSALFWAPWHQSMSTYSQLSFSSSTWKRDGVWMGCAN